MSKWRERQCTQCQEILFTASRSEICLTCKAKMKSSSAVEKERDIITDYGYQIIGDPITNKFGKRVYSLKIECCGKVFDTVYGNLISGIKKNEQSGYNKLPCGHCGPKARMAKALEGYVDKHGRDYDEEIFNDYKRKVRGLSDRVYLKNKERINPENYKRGLAGQEGVYHLDHKVPIIECFKCGWTPEQAAAVENLQMLWWKDNLTKGSEICL